jgi:hypothetical protein
MDGGREAISARRSHGTSEVCRLIFTQPIARITPRTTLMVLAWCFTAVAVHAQTDPLQGLPESRVGTFTQALYDEAKKDGWIVISMKNDWKRIFTFER